MATDSQTLAELNERSKGLGAWEVGIFRPVFHKYTYTAKHSGQVTEGAALRMILVSLTDPSQYVTAHFPMRSGRMKPLTKAEAKRKWSFVSVR